MDKSLYLAFLGITKQQPHSTNFDLLTHPKITESLVSGITQILTSEDNSIIMKTLRREMIDFVRRKCCSRNNTKKQTDLMIKHGILSNKEEFHEKIFLYKKLDLHFGSSVRDSYNIPLEVGVALLNINTENSNGAVKELIGICLQSHEEPNDKLLEFLCRVWDSEHIKLEADVCGFLTERIVHHFEDNLIKIATILLDMEIEPFETEPYANLLENHFENVNVVIERLHKCDKFFQTFFYILSDLFIKSSYNKNIYNFTVYVYEKMSFDCGNQELIDLYPDNLRNLVFFLQCDISMLKRSKQLFDRTVCELEMLNKISKLDVVMLLMHHNKWLEEL